jgi:hypothetical protein
VPQQQEAVFVANPAKNPLSDPCGFGMMRMASQKEFQKVITMGRHNPHRGSPRIRKQ